jgi:nucleoside 2-deoxyribosyltransferase
MRGSIPLTPTNKRNEGIKMKVYLASPFFNVDEIHIYNRAIEILRGQHDIDLFVPREHTIPNGWDMPNHVWAENVFAVDLLALQKAEVVVVLNHGLYSDTGTAWECGYAYALNKQVVMVNYGYDDTEYSLMMLNGCSSVVSFGDLCIHTLREILKKRMNYADEFEQK